MSNFNNPIKTKCWKKFLEASGCEFNRITSSHHIWKCPGCKRSIVFRGAEKEIPQFHISTCLKTMDISKSQFNNWIENNC